MDWKPWRLKYWMDLFKRPQGEQDLDDEIRSHVEMEVRRRIDAGESPEIARNSALRGIRSIALVKESTRDSWAWTAFERLFQDLRYAVRVLRRSPLFAAIVVLSLAIGIGANTVLFSFIDAVLFRPLPVNRPDRLVLFEWHAHKQLFSALNGTTNIDPATNEETSTSFSYLTFQNFREQSQALSDVFACDPLYGVSVSADNQPERIQGQLVSGNYFAGLGVTAAAGRTIDDADDRQRHHVAVISYRFWQRRFSLNPDVIGKPVTMNGIPLTIVGVTKAGFSGARGFGTATDISAPLSLEPEFDPAEAYVSKPWTWWLLIMGRMRDGVQMTQVQSELQGAFEGTALEGWREAPDDSNKASKKDAAPEIPWLRVAPGAGGFSDNFDRPSLLLVPLGAITGFVLLIVCINVANLLLARTASRRREMAVRLSLGGSRLRLLRQLLTETVLLSCIGGMLGAAIAEWGKGALLALLPETGHAFYDLRIDPRVLTFTVLLSVVTGILFGLAPALRAVRENINPLLKESSQNLAARRTRWSKGLLIAQIALSMVLLTGAGLFVRTLHNLQAADLGFGPKNVLLFQIDPGSLNYDKGRIANLYRQAIDRIAALPGVTGASYSAYPLAGTSGSNSRISIDGKDVPSNKSRVHNLRVRANFLHVMGIPIVAGRDLTVLDTEGNAKVAIVNEAFARSLFGHDNPVGAHFGLDDRQHSGDIEIVGVAKDVSIRLAREAVPPTVFLPATQGLPGNITITVRTAGDPLLLMPSMRNAMREVDANIPLDDIQTQEELVQRGFVLERMFATASAGFGATALLLACIGLFGLMSYNVERRTNEIGVRMALGAQRRDVVQLVMRQTFILLAVGALIGIGLSAALMKALAASPLPLFYKVAPYDPVSFIAATVLLAAVALTAAYLPARRASRIEPTIALRYD